MEYKVVKKLNRYYYEDEKGRLYGDKYGKGFVYAIPFKEGKAVVQKDDGICYCLNTKFEELGQVIDNKDLLRKGGGFELFTGINTFYLDDRLFYKFHPIHLIFREGLAFDNKGYFIDQTGKKVFGPYKDADYFCDGVAVVKKDDGKSYYINRAGKEIAGPFAYAAFFQEDMAYAQKDDGKWYYINKAGKEVAGPFADIGGFSEGVGRVKKDDGKWYYINKKGKDIAGPFAELEAFEEGMGRVKKDDGKWYYINKKGEEIAGPYRELLCFTNGVGRAQKDDLTWFYVGTDGKEIAGPFEKILAFNEKDVGQAQKEDGKWYFIDKKGNEVAGPFKNDASFYKGVGQVEKDDGMRYFVDETGKQIAGPYTEVFSWGNGEYTVTEPDGKKYKVDETFKCCDAADAWKYAEQDPRFVDKISNALFVYEDFVDMLHEDVGRALYKMSQSQDVKEKKLAIDLSRFFIDYCANKKDEIAAIKKEIERKLAAGRRKLAITKLIEEDETENWG